MALLTVATVTSAGVDVTLTAVNLTDTISSSDIGERGVWLEVANTDVASRTVSVSDPGKTPASNPASVPTVTIPANTGRKRIFVGPKNVDLVSGVATITYSATAGVTAQACRY